MVENWKTVAGWPYEVSDLGNVRGRRGISKPMISHKGYLRVCLRNGESVKYVTIHSLVLTAFVGDRPPKYQGCHNDGDKTNNIVSNLKWGTGRENYDDKRRHGRAQECEAHGSSKLTADQVDEIRFAYATRWERYWGAKEFAKKYGVSQSTVERAARGVSWTALKSQQPAQADGKEKP